jgi:xanthine dehydrogenase molybdenum-binding subunit
MGDRYRFIGKELPRLDGPDIVTGGARYLADIKVPGMFYGKVLRSPHAHAVVKRIDKSKAQALRGVKAVLTWEDIPDWRGGTPRVLRVLDRKVRFVGDAVALVAATTEKVALDATRLIDVECEVLPGVFDMEAAVRPGAPRLYDEFPGIVLPPGAPFFGPKSLKGVFMGDVEAGFTEADTITEGSFSYENIPNPLPAEPPGAIAPWEEPNNLTVWVSNQTSYMDKVILSIVTNRQVEVTTSPGPSAVLMAAWNALGVWMHEYPLTPDKDIESLRGKRVPVKSRHDGETRETGGFVK